MSAGPRRRQPRGLAILFLTEMWERFGYYTLVYLLALYLTGELKMADGDADLLYGTYTSFILLTTVVGGFLADRLLGFRRSILLGIAIMAAGYALLGFGGAPLLYLGLATLVVGNGFFKANVSSLLGTLYDQDDPRRESGFVLFYMGINVGAFSGSLGAGYLATAFGYQVAFLVAAGAMLVAFTVFASGRRWLDGAGLPPPGDALRHGRTAGVPNLAVFVAGTVAAVALAGILLVYNAVAGAFVAVVGVSFLATFLYEIRREGPRDRAPLIVLVVLFLFAAVFWAVYAQSGLSVVLFIERAVDRVILGGTVPASSFISLGALFILLTAPVFSLLWTRLARSGRNPPIPMKFVVGFLFMATAYFVLAMAGRTAVGGGLVPPVWMVLFFFLFTCGEMCVSPVGLAMVTAWAPQRLLGFAMGMWFLSNAVANYLGGLLARRADVPAGAPASATDAIYVGAFFDYALIAAATALLLAVMAPLLLRLLRGRATA